MLFFRGAALDDARHVAFAAKFGELDDIKPYIALGRKNRFDYDELFDVSNLNDDGSIAQTGTRRYWLGQGNSLFHVDSSFNPRRAGFSLLRAHQLPPLGNGGDTQFADARTAFDELDEGMKKKLIEEDYVAAHSLWHSRKTAAPDFEEFKSIDPQKFPFGRHKLIQKHEGSGRMNLYIASHVHHLEKQDPRTGKLDEVDNEVSQPIIRELLKHTTRPENVLSVEWKEDGDLVVWDNTCVMHRVDGGAYEGKYVRDMRRCTVHDGSGTAWGFNEKNAPRMGLP